MRVEELFTKEFSVADMARGLGISVQAIYKWEVVPLNRVRAVASLTGIPCEKLRPDFFSAAQESVPAPLQVAQLPESAGVAK